jgi:hypothetical protein
MSSERNFRDIGDIEDGSKHWIAIGEACDKLLARLVKHHGKENAPRFEQRAPAKSKEQPPSPKSNCRDEQ